jgi:predicted nucleic acid-binding Zn finger protein
MACATITAIDQEARVARAMREEFTFTPHNPGEFICETAAGNAYLTSEEFCTCGDWNYRCSKVEGSRCKHQVALGQKLIADGALTVAKGLRMTREETPATADFDAEFARIFG